MVRELQRMIREGRLGKIQQIQIEMPQECFLRLGANPQDWRRVDYAVPTVSLDLGVHVHHLVDFLTGGYKPQRLVGDQSSYGQFGGLIDNVYCLAHYERDIRVNAWWGKTALGLRNGLQIRVFGDSASAEWMCRKWGRFTASKDPSIKKVGATCPPRAGIKQVAPTKTQRGEA